MYETTTMDTIMVYAARVEDWSQIEALLKRSNLPTDGLRDHLRTTLVAKHNDQVVGSAALEMYGSYALLRSVAVAPEQRGHGLGHQLTTAALDLAQRHGATQVYLLTETAAHFFPRFGFTPVERAAVPASIQQSIEFTSACPASALVMMTALNRQQ